MMKYFGIILISIFCFFSVRSQVPIVIDSISQLPLPNASIFSANGNFIGVTDTKGQLPYIDNDVYPIIVRYLGFKEKYISSNEVDSIFLQENVVELPELIIESRNHKLLHILAYVREYSTLSTYTDTVFLFREKMVDFMVPHNSDSKFNSWNNPRILKSKSYYRFTDSNGLDSVSNQCNHHFSWSDWVGILPSIKPPTTICVNSKSNDTIRGKYSPTEIWKRNLNNLSLEVNVLADTLSRKWVPNLNLFFRENLDFEQFRVKYNFTNFDGDSISSEELTGYSFIIESNGRCRDMFRFNSKDEPFFVSTYTEVYIVDKEYITLREAKRWNKSNFFNEEIVIYEPQEAPELQPAIQLLVDRVNNVDYDKLRLRLTPDQRLAGRKIERNFGQKVFQRLKDLLGISKIVGKRRQDKQWKEFRKDQLNRNNN